VADEIEEFEGLREGVGEDAIVWGDEPYKVQYGSITVDAPGSPVSRKSPRLDCFAFAFRPSVSSPSFTVWFQHLFFNDFRKDSR
jgi:hypothetical protein